MKNTVGFPRTPFAPIFIMIGTFLSFLAPIQGQVLKGRVLDERSKEPIPYATVQLAPNGTITNEEGFFSIDMEGTEAETSLQVSSMGYNIKLLPLAALDTESIVIYLNENVITLNSVYVTNKQPSATELMQKVLENLPKNYRDTGFKQQFFYRNSMKNITRELDVDVKKNSGMTTQQKAELNKSISDLKLKIHPLYVEVLGDFYKNGDSKTKLTVTKATRLSQPKEQQGVLPPDVLQLVKTIFKDSTKTYKLKSGWFKIEDSLAVGELTEKKDAHLNTLNVGSYKNDINEVMLNHGFRPESSQFQFVLDQELYDYSLEDTFDGPEGFIYKIGFSPRKRAGKYSGTLYVDSGDYAVIKTQFDYAEGKRGEHVNLKLLLGFKYAETVWKSTVIYSRQPDGYYMPRYIVQEQVREIYVNRPIKLVENRTKDKLELNIKTTQLIADKKELLFLDSREVTLTDFNAIQEQKQLPYEQLERYDASVWKDYPVMEPLEEMKNFKMVGEAQ